jgi:DNA polymerase III epsilon subunit-like protein
LGWLVVAGIVWFFFSANSSKPRKKPQRKRSTYSKPRSTYSSGYKPRKTTPYTPKSRPSQGARKKSSAPYYTGPLFAAPGTVSTVFGYGSYDSENELPNQFAIIDLETSGISPKNGRVIELAVLVTNLEGETLRSFSTLINPRDENVGRTDIHGISLNDLNGAPAFEEITGNLIEVLQGSIIVAHNAKFEEKFLAMEFKAAGLELPVLPALDTLWLSQIVLDLYDYKLNTVISHFGERIENAHTAFGDVEAVSKVLPQMLGLSSQIKYPVAIPTLPILTPSKNIKPRT